MCVDGIIDSLFSMFDVPLNQCAVDVRTLTNSFYGSYTDHWTIHHFSWTILGLDNRVPRRRWCICWARPFRLRPTVVLVATLDVYVTLKIYRALMALADSSSNSSEACSGVKETAQVDNLNGVCVYPYKWRCLPQEIVFEILLRLPAQVIHDVMRSVYDKWKLMISTKDFIYNHLWNSTPGIIIMEENKTANGIYVEMRRGRLEICKFDSRDSYIVGSRVNGLVLAIAEGKKGDKEALYIINPLTEQREAVPYEFGSLERTTLALDEASMKYKVVRSFCPKSSPCVSVLTIGVDNDWRNLDMKHISKQGRESLFFHPFATRGYVHWMGNSSVLTMNAETLRNFLHMLL